jgi:hypothetical protein
VQVWGFTSKRPSSGHIRIHCLKIIVVVVVIAVVVIVVVVVVDGIDDVGDGVDGDEEKRQQSERRKPSRSWSRTFLETKYSCCRRC